MGSIKIGFIASWLIKYLAVLTDLSLASFLMGYGGIITEQKQQNGVFCMIRVLTASYNFLLKFYLN